MTSPHSPEPADHPGAAPRGRLLGPAFERSSLAMFVVDGRGLLDGLNEAAARLIGAAAEELVGRPVSELLDPVVLGTAPADGSGSDAGRAAGPSVRDAELIARDGSRRPVAVAAIPIPDGQGAGGHLLEVRTRPAEPAEGADLVGRELRYRLVADASNDAIWDWNLVTDEVVWNEGVRTRFGYRGAEVRPESGWWVENIHPDDRPRVVGGIHEHIDGGREDWQAEYRFRRADGSFAVVLDRGRVLRDHDGRPIRMVGSMLDLSERRASEAALRAAEERFSFVRRSSGVGFWYCDLPFDRLEWDELVKDHFHLRPDAVVTIGLFYERIHPDDREPTRLAIETSIREHAPYDVRYRTVHPETGEEKWIHAIGRTFYASDGTPTRFDGITVDATAQVRAEEALKEQQLRFRLMADSIDQMVWVTRPDGFHEYYNKRWYDYTGVPEGSTDGEGWNGVFHPEDQPRAWARWRHSLATGESYEIEYRLRHRSGEYRWVLGRALPQRGEDGAIQKWFGTCTDIHDRRRAAEEREALLREAEVANRMKDEFLATLSHELRTPLNAVVGWTRILRSGKVDAEDLQEGLEVIDRNARAQAQLIEDLLDLSRIISGKLTLDVQRLDLIDVIEAAVDAVRPAAAAKTIDIKTVLDSLAGPVPGDPTRLQQVVWNLLTNAIKFTPKGGKVQVLLERVNSHVEISVIDTGIGIRPEFLPHVFDRFRQADSSTTRRHGGLGLGLSIVKQLVEMHGGSVRVKSPGEGQGSTFVVALPIVVVHPELPSKVRPKESGSRDPREVDCADGLLSGLKLLVVDDEPDARHLVKKVLSDCGADVTVAGSVVEALSRIDGGGLEILISDVGMPDQDGYDLIRQVRKRHSARDLPALALSAFARSEDRTRALRAGFQTHLAKPIDPAELIASVASLAGRTGEAVED